MLGNIKRAEVKIYVYLYLITAPFTYIIVKITKIFGRRNDGGFLFLNIFIALSIWIYIEKINPLIKKKTEDLKKQKPTTPEKKADIINNSVKQNNWKKIIEISISIVLFIILASSMSYLIVYKKKERGKLINPFKQNTNSQKNDIIDPFDEKNKALGFDITGFVDPLKEEQPDTSSGFDISQIAFPDLGKEPSTSSDFDVSQVILPKLGTQKEVQETADQPKELIDPFDLQPEVQETKSQPVGTINPFEHAEVSENIKK